MSAELDAQEDRSTQGDLDAFVADSADASGQSPADAGAAAVDTGILDAGAPDTCMYVTVDAGPLCTVPCDTVFQNGAADASCPVPCSELTPQCLDAGFALACTTYGDCQRFGLQQQGQVLCVSSPSSCGVYTCPLNYPLCTNDCYCDSNETLINGDGTIVQGFNTCDFDSGSAGGCSRCRLNAF